MKTDTLTTIVEAKKTALAARKQSKPYASLEAELRAMAPSSVPGFFETLKAESPRPKIIAEVKKASPSRGIIRDDFSLQEISQAYQSSPHVAAISILTEEDHFQGSDDILAFFAEHNTHKKPLLRKDFIFDPYQVLESKLLGAQAYLLIAALLDEGELRGLVDLGLELGIEPLVEVHDEQELAMALKTKARVIGINCRNLKDFTIDRGRHALLKQLDDTYARVAESAIDTPEYLREVSAFSDAALIGTEFMKSEDIGAAIEALAGAGR